VAFSGRRRDVGQALLEELSGRGSELAFIQSDVSAVDGALGVVAAAVERFGRVDSVLNSAATVDRGTLLETTPELFDKHVNTNLRGPFFIMQASIKDMLRRKAGGTIVNILSISMHTGQTFLSAYVATKAGLAGLTKNAAHSHRYDRIRINGVNIGWTITEGEDRIQRETHEAPADWLEQVSPHLPMGRLGQPDEIADFLIFLLSDRSGVVTGSVIDWDQCVIGAVDGVMGGSE
jgi:NAD(P)-dependent dehydrogenase (short-subunit alcohol dehydrogenase family)